MRCGGGQVLDHRGDDVVVMAVTKVAAKLHVLSVISSLKVIQFSCSNTITRASVNPDIGGRF